MKIVKLHTKLQKKLSINPNYYCCRKNSRITQSKKMFKEIVCCRSRARSRLSTWWQQQFTCQYHINNSDRALANLSVHNRNSIDHSTVNKFRELSGWINLSMYFFLWVHTSIYNSIKSVHFDFDKSVLNGSLF